MAVQTPDDFERSILGIASLVLFSDSMPAKIIKADQQNESDDWKEAADRERSEASIDDYLDNIEAGVRFLTTPKP